MPYALQNKNIDLYYYGGSTSRKFHRKLTVFTFNNILLSVDPILLYSVDQFLNLTLLIFRMGKFFVLWIIAYLLATLVSKPYTPRAPSPQLRQ